MKLLLQRGPSSLESTLGDLYIDGRHECVTLEDVVRADGIKIAGETAIPAGSYTVDITYSPRFHCDMPLLIHVAGYIGVRIHWGNKSKDSDGCILVGQSKGIDWINNSRAAYAALFDKLKACKSRGESITLAIAPHVSSP